MCGIRVGSGGLSCVVSVENGALSGWLLFLYFTRGDTCINAVSSDKIWPILKYRYIMRCRIIRSTSNISHHTIIESAVRSLLLHGVNSGSKYNAASLALLMYF